MFSVTRLTQGPKFHFKCYYDLQPWDRAMRRFLCYESDFQDRSPRAEDTLTLGVVNLPEGVFEPLTTTRAWNFQQGCMAHWMPGSDDREIIFNDRVGDRFQAVVYSLDSGARRVLPLPIQAVSPDGRTAATINYARWGEHRPGYGYAGLRDPYHGIAQPAEEAVHLMDLHTGDSRALVRLPDVARLTSDRDARRGAPMIFCHLIFNRSGTHLAGLARWWCPELARTATQAAVNIDGAVPERRHCLWVAKCDGSELKILANDALVSHAAWRDDKHLVYWGNRHTREPAAYRLCNVDTLEWDVIGPSCLTEDGHMSYDRDGRFLVTDTYPDAALKRTLKVYDPARDREIVLGRFASPPVLDGELRCDLHPCWSPDDRQVAFDSIHAGGARQVYVVNVGDLDHA